MNIKFIKQTAYLTLFVALAGCAQKERHDSALNSIGNIQANISSKVNDAKQGNLTKHGGYEQYVTNDFWVDTTPIVLSKAEINQELNRRFTYTSGIKLPLTSLTEDLSSATGIRFSLSPELISGIRKTIGGVEQSDVDEGKNGSDQTVTFVTKFQPNWVNATVKDAIDSISSNLNLSWKYIKEENRVHLYKFKTKTYRVHLTSETIQQKSSMTNESLVSGDGANLSGTAITTDVALSTDPWEGLINRLDVIKSESGRYSVDKHNFTVTLNDSDQVHDVFETIVNDVNKDSLKEIVFDITLMTVTGSQRDLYGVNYNALYEKSLKTIGLVTPRVIDADLTSLSYQKKLNNVDHFEGAQIFVDALSTFGKASIVDSFQRTVLNNGVAPIMLSRNRPYLRSVANLRNINDDNNNIGISSGSTATLTDLVTGFFLTIRPHVIDDNDVLVSMTINRRSAPGEFEQVQIAENLSLERPDIQDDSDFRQFLIRNNETKIIAGSIREDTLIQDKGTVDHDLWWLGGNQENGSRRRMMILFVTARII